MQFMGKAMISISQVIYCHLLGVPFITDSHFLRTTDTECKHQTFSATRNIVCQPSVRKPELAVLEVVT